MAWSIDIVETSPGRSPVARFIERLPVPLRARLARDIDLLSEFGIQLGPPYVKKLSGTTSNLWELRTRRAGDQLRTLFIVEEKRRIVLLHSFLKKTRRVPRKEIETAQRRFERLLRRRS